MKKVFLLFVLMFVSASSFAQSTVYVNGHYRSNGTYVNGYYKTVPNQTVLDNYSTKGNYNPYTGNYGTVTPYNYRSVNTLPNYSKTSYDTPSYSSYSSSPVYRTVYTGPRGGNYYINSNGNKTYVRR